MANIYFFKKCPLECFFNFTFLWSWVSYITARPCVDYLVKTILEELISLADLCQIKKLNLCMKNLLQTNGLVCELIFPVQINM